MPGWLYVHERRGVSHRHVATYNGAMRFPILAAPAMFLIAACADNPCGSPPPPAELAADHVLLHPDSPELRATPPDSFDVELDTSEGTVRVRVHRAWAPLGAARFYNLARNGFYDGSRFFRVLPGFAAQFGMNGTPAIDSVWLDRTLHDDPPVVPTGAGTLSYAMAGPGTRTTQLFFSYRANEALDAQGFVPIGRVIEGMDAVFRLNAEYGEVPPVGTGPSFGCIVSHGNHYLTRRYPRLDHIVTARVIEL